jgi:hypothetical protein
VVEMETAEGAENKSTGMEELQKKEECENEE